MGIPAAIGVASSGKPNLGDQATAVVSGVLTGIGPGDPFAFRGPMDVAIFASVTALAFTTTNGSLAASVSSGAAMATGVAINSANVPPGTTWATFSGTSGTLALPAVSLECYDFSISSPLVRLPAGSNVSRLLGAAVTVPSNAEQLALPANTTVLEIVQADIAPTSGGTTGTSPGQPGIIRLSAAPTIAPTNGRPRAQQPLRFQLTSAAVATGVDAVAVFTGAGIVYVGTVQLERSFDGGYTWIVCNSGGLGDLAQYAAGTPVSLTFGDPERNVLYRVNCIAYTSGVINYRFSQTGGANESLAIGPLAGG